MDPAGAGISAMNEADKKPKGEEYTILNKYEMYCDNNQPVLLQTLIKLRL